MATACAAAVRRLEERQLEVGSPAAAAEERLLDAHEVVLLRGQLRPARTA